MYRNPYPPNSRNGPIIAADWEDVAAKLPGKWSVRKLWGFVKLLRSDGLQLLVNVNSDTPKVKVRLVMNGAEGELIYTGEPFPAINVTPTRDAAILAKDIARRLIPNAEAYREVLLERAAAKASFDAKLEDIRQKLLFTEAGIQSNFDSRLYMSGEAISGEVRFTPERVYIDNLSLPLDKALQMLAILKD